MTLPNVGETAVNAAGHFSPAWRNWLSAIERAVSQTTGTATDASAAIAAIATALGSPDGTVEGIPDQNWLADFVVRAGPGISVFGTPRSGAVVISATGGSTGMPAVMARISMRA